MSGSSLEILRERARLKRRAAKVDRDALALIASRRPIRPAEIDRDVLQALLERLHLGSDVRSLASSASLRKEPPPLTIAADGSLTTSITTVVALAAPARPNPRPQTRTAKPNATTKGGDALAFQSIAALADRAEKAASRVPKRKRAASRRSGSRSGRWPRA
jgi:hypothetical protein